MDCYEKLMVIVGPCLSLAILPHLYQMYTSSSSLGQSVWSPALMLIFCVLWMIYGFRKNDVPIFLTNWIAFLINSAYLSFIMCYQ